MSNNQTNKIDEYAKVFKAISNPNRLKILIHLLDCCKPGTQCSPEQLQTFCVSEIGDLVEVSKSTLSHHLKELTQANLIITKRKGQRIYCSLNVELVEEIKRFFG